MCLRFHNLSKTLTHYVDNDVPLILALGVPHYDLVCAGLVSSRIYDCQANILALDVERYVLVDLQFLTVLHHDDLQRRLLYTRHLKKRLNMATPSISMLSLCQAPPYLVRDVPVAVFVRHASDGRDISDFWRLFALRDVEADVEKGIFRLNTLNLVIKETTHAQLLTTSSPSP